VKSAAGGSGVRRLILVFHQASGVVIGVVGKSVIGVKYYQENQDDSGRARTKLSRVA